MINQSLFAQFCEQNQQPSTGLFNNTQQQPQGNLFANQSQLQQQQQPAQGN